MSELNLILLGPARGRQGHPGGQAEGRLRAALHRHRRPPAQAQGGGDRARPRGEVLHGQRRPRPRRAGHPDDPRGDRGAAAPRASCSTASRARSARPTRSPTRSPTSGRSLTAALLIEADDETVIRRLSGRRQCKNGHLYHVEFDPPKNDGLLRPGRQAALPARRRQGRDDQEAARDLPAEDRAADRLLRGARAAAPVRRRAVAGRRSTTTSAPRSRALRLEEQL